MNSKFTPQKKAAFLAGLAATCSIRLACEAAGISRQTAYTWRLLDDQFARGWVRSKEYGFEALEDEAVRRGVEGYEEPVFYKGAAVGTIRKYSDRMLTTLLQANIPHKYHMNKYKLDDFEVVRAPLDPKKEAAKKAMLARYDEILDEGVEFERYMASEENKSDSEIDDEDLA